MDQEHTFSTLSGNIGSTTGRDEGIIRVILTADNHLSAYSPKLSPTKLAERRRRLGLAFKQVIDAAIERRAHLFIQAGDLFDSVDPRNRERDFVAEQLMRLQSAGTHTFGVSGNHDTPRQKTEQGGFAPQNIYHRLKILLANSKSGERYHKKGHFSPLSGEYQPPLMLEKNRTSLRKSNSPTIS